MTPIVRSHSVKFIIAVGVMSATVGFSAVGADASFEPHTVEEAQRVQDGDAFLLATDGWWDALQHGAIESTFAIAHTADEWLELMVAQVRQAADPMQDNFSAVAVWVGDPAQTTRFQGL